MILWGTGFDLTSEKFDALYTDMTWVKVDRKSQDLEHEDLQHYTDMLVKEWIKKCKKTLIAIPHE